MSNTWHLACEDCKKTLWIGQGTGQRFTLYTGDDKCMAAFHRFMHDHLGHNLKMLIDDIAHDGEYESIDY